MPQTDPRADAPTEACPTTALVVAGASGLALSLAFLAAWAARGRGTMFDDAYMFVRYARNLASGHGMAWNPGEGAVYGVTSLPHTLWVYVILELGGGLHDSWTVFVASASAAAIWLVLLAFAVAAADPAPARTPILPHGRAGLLRLLVAAGLVWPFVTWPGSLFGIHAASGMDTMLSAAALAGLGLAGLALGRAPSVPRALGAAAVAWIAYLVRPDNGLHAALLPPLVCLGWLGPRAGRRPALWFGAAFVVLLALDAAVKTAVFGEPLPLPFYAKQFGDRLGYVGGAQWNPWSYMQQWMFAGLPFWLVGALLFRRSDLRFVLPFAVPTVATFAWLLSVTQVMGGGARFYYPSLTFLVLGCAVVVQRRAAEGALLETVRGSWPAGLARAAVPAALLALCGLVESPWARHVLAPEQPVARATHPTTSGRVPPEIPWAAGLLAVADVLSAAPPGTSVALSEHGVVGAIAPRAHLIDVLGLHDPEFAHQGFSAERLFARGPDMIWMPHEHYRAAVRDIEQHPTFRDADAWDYWPRVFNYGVALRRDGPHYTTLRRLLAQAVAATYGGARLADFRAERSG